MTTIPSLSQAYTVTIFSISIRGLAFIYGVYQQRFLLDLFFTFELFIQSFHEFFFHGVYSGKSSLFEGDITLRINNKISGNSSDIEVGH